MTPKRVAAVLAIALSVRTAAAVPIRFPALDDPAYYLTVARNIGDGRGMVIDAVWSYLVPFAHVTHPSNEYWMPLAALALAPVFWLFGPSFGTAQAVGVAAGSLLVLPAMATASRLTPERHKLTVSVVAGLATALNPLLVYQSAVPDSALTLALTAGPALWLAGADKKIRPGAIGVLTGLGYLARADGIVLAPVVALWALLRKGRTAGVLAIAGFGLVTAPWWVRQAAVFGSPFPVPALIPALLPDYPSLFSWPTPTPEILYAQTGLVRLAALRLEGLAHNFSDVLLPALGGMFPFAAIALPAAVRDARLTPTLVGGAVLFAASALLFPITTMHGTFYHSVAAVLPVLIGIGATGIATAATWWDTRRGWNRSAFGPLAAAVLVLTTAQSAALVSRAVKMHAQWERQFETVGNWLAEQPPGVIMTTQPHSLHYATGRPTVMLPAAQPPEVALSAARYYGARYLILTERFGRFPDALVPPSPGFQLVFEGDGTQIYAVKPE